MRLGALARYAAVVAAVLLCLQSLPSVRLLFSLDSAVGRATGPGAVGPADRRSFDWSTLHDAAAASKLVPRPSGDGGEGQRCSVRIEYRASAWEAEWMRDMAGAVRDAAKAV